MLVTLAHPGQRCSVLPEQKHYFSLKNLNEAHFLGEFHTTGEYELVFHQFIQDFKLFYKDVQEFTTILDVKKLQNFLAQALRFK